MTEKQKKLYKLLEELQGGLNDEFIDAISELVLEVDSWAMNKSLDNEQLQTRYHYFLDWLEEYERNTYQSKSTQVI